MQFIHVAIKSGMDLRKTVSLKNIDSIVQFLKREYTQWRTYFTNFWATQSLTTSKCSEIVHPWFSPEVLKEKIGTGTWLTDEYILVLVKAGKPKEAIDLYVELEQYDKAA